MGTIRLAWRALARRPLFTGAAVVTLALGVGLNTTVFSAVHALLLRPLPGVEAPERMVQLYRSWPGGMAYGSNSIPHFLDVRDRAEGFDGVALWGFLRVNLSTTERNELVYGQIVSANYFDVLGVRPVLGRTFLAEEDTGLGAHPVVVLGYEAWQGRFGGDPGIVGRELIVNGMPYTVVGVAAPGFRGVMPVATPVLWAPLTMQPQLQARESLWEVRGNNQFNVVGRLAEGTTVEQARAGLDAVNRQLAQEHPEQYRGSGITVVPQSDAGLHPVMASAQVAVSAVLMGVVGLLLLLACVNLANLFLARARERRREMAIRASIGASRGRLVRHLLAEALILSLMAGALALLLARVAVTLANGLTLPIDIPFAAGLEIGWPVVAFALGVSLLAGLLFGLVPALEASHPDLVSGLKDGSDRGGGYRRSLMSRGLVVAQIALSLVLLVNAGLFLRSLREATHLERGFDADRLLLASVDPSLQGYDPERTRVFFDQLVQRVRAIPGVRAAALGEMVPLGINNQQGEVSVPGHVYADDERTAVDYHHAAAGYFETMGIPMEEGRGFTEQGAGQNVVVINRRFADRFWPGESALGRTIVRRDVEYTVIGVTSTGRYRSLGEAPLEYMHFQLPERWSSALTLHVRTSGDPSLALPLVRRELEVLDPSLPLFDVMTMERHLGLTLLPARIAGGALGLFGLIGLLLAGVGTYGVLAVSVAQRTREIGIRMALGAEGGRVVRLVLGQTLRMVGMGVLIGLVGAAFLGRAVEGMLYGVSGADPVAFGAVSVLLVGVALVASVVPAWRAVRVEPVGALRGE